ncbi:MAG: hypothetical protein ABI595_08400 [Actinomycetota bacterium]
MKRLVRAVFVMAVISAPVLGAGLARADDPATLFTCPSTLGGLPLTEQDANASQVDPWFGEHGASFDCVYQTEGVDGGSTVGDRRLSAGVIWETQAISPEGLYCRGDGSALNDVGSNGEMISTLSTDRRAFSFANQSTDHGGSHGIPIQPAIDLAAEMLPLAEARAAPCPGMSEGGGPSVGGTTDGGSATTGSTGETGTVAEPADADGSDGAGVPLVVGGLVAAVVGGAGSMVLGKGGGGSVQLTPPADKLFSGQEALDLLHSAGLIEPVLDATGRPVGFRPLGDLQQLLDAASPWQPAFAHPLATPDGGTATHLSGVAFEPRPDGTISSITVAVRPGGAATPNGAPAPVPTPSPDPAQPPGASLGDQLWAAQMEAVATGVPIDAVLDKPDRPPGPSLADSVYIDSIETTAETINPDGPISALPPTSLTAPAPAATASSGPPADPALLDRWLTTPGGKTITAEDLHALAPKLIGEGGKVKSGLYKGGQVVASIDIGGVNVTVHPPDSPDSLLDLLLPDIDVIGTLSTNAGRLVVDIPGQASDSVVTKAVQKHLDGLNGKLARAGMGIDGLEVQKGAISMVVGPTH